LKESISYVKSLSDNDGRTACCVDVVVVNDHDNNLIFRCK